MYEVSDIVDRRLEGTTQTYLYKVRFKGYSPEEDTWLPSAAFNQRIEFKSTSRFGRKRKHQTARENEIDPFSSHFIPAKMKKTCQSGKSKQRKISEMTSKKENSPRSNGEFICNGLGRAERFISRSSHFRLDKKKTLFLRFKHSDKISSSFV